jgi:CBS domain containing-hemolysin-like protein
MLNHLIDEYQKEGLVTPEEKLMFKNITNFSDKKVNTIMTPRADIISVKYSSNLEEVKKIINEDGHTRLPVFKNNNEEIIGFIHTKDMARYLCQENKIFNIDNILRKILFIPGSMKLPDVLLRMRISRVHMAIVLDEFGGIDGLVTIENIVEEIIGDIEDEHDIIENDSFFTIKKIDDYTFQFGGRVDINKAQDLLKTNIININEPDNYQTIGGFILYYFNRIPEIGEEIEKFNLNFRIIDSNNRVVKLIEVKKSNIDN